MTISSLRRPPLHYPDRPFHHFLSDAADRHPERFGLIFGSDRYTYRDLDGLANAVARSLAGLGFRPGQRAALVVTNRPEWIIAQHGISLAGGSAVMPNPSWTAGELSSAFGITRPAAVVADGHLVPVVEAAEGAPALRICLDDPAPDGWLAFADLVYRSSGRRPEPLDGDLAALEAALPFSSGTTGLPKAVRHTHATLVAGTVNWKAASTIGENDRLQFFLPLFHIYGICCVAAAIAAGAPVTLFPRFDLDVMLRHIEEERITIGFGAAPIAAAMANHPDLERYDLSSLRYMLWAATPVNPAVAEAVSRRTGIRWLGAYGATEAPCLHCNPVHAPDRWRLDSPGLPLSDVEVAVVDLETRAPVPPGGEGEVLVRAPHVMAGYLPKEADAEAFEDGWLRTGDVGWVEPDGWIHLTDRHKEMIKVNAFSVAPAEIEAVLFEHPAVADCAVYGVPDSLAGEVPKAAVVVRPGAQVTEAELTAHVAAKLAGYKHVRHVAFVDAVPRTASGKVLRRVLRDADAVPAAS
ncbi:MAG TPA: AMP-binding protein [Acidimicrobiia bacterium]|nr:AMP-binding protein [Acidimicrobiia bacterium]